MNSAVKIGLVAVGGYIIATRTNLLCMVGIGASCGAAPQPTTGGPAPGPTPGVVPAPVAAAPPVAFNTLAAIYDRLSKSLAANNVPMQQGQYVATPWVFNYYFNQVSGLNIGSVMGTLFPSPGDTATITLPQFWAVVAPWLNQSQGLSGLGLAMLAARLRGLGCTNYGRYSCYPARLSFAQSVARMSSGSGSNH